MEKTNKFRQLTAEQLALSQARKEQKIRQLQKTRVSTLDSRQWLAFPSQKTDELSHRVRVLSWNVR